MPIVSTTRLGQQSKDLSVSWSVKKEIVNIAAVSYTNLIASKVICSSLTALQVYPGKGESILGRNQLH